MLELRPTCENCNRAPPPARQRVDFSAKARRALRIGCAIRRAP